MIFTLTRNISSRVAARLKRFTAYLADSTSKAPYKHLPRTMQASCNSWPSYTAEAKERQKAAGAERMANADRGEHGVVQLKQQIAEAGDEPKIPNKTSAELAAEATGVLTVNTSC